MSPNLESPESPKQEPEAPATVKCGSVWEIPSKSRKPVQVSRPDGTTANVLPVNGVALHVLGISGEYVCGKHKVTAE